MQQGLFEHLLSAASAVVDDYPELLTRRNADDVLATVAKILIDGRITPFEVLTFIFAVINLHSADHARVVVQLRQLAESAVNEDKERVSVQHVSTAGRAEESALFRPPVSVG